MCGDAFSGEEEERKKGREKREERREKREETRLRCVSRLIEGTNLAILVRRWDLTTHPPPSPECALFPKESWSAATDFEHPRKEKRETK